MRFSQRLGLTPISKSIQLESIDDDLKSRLWNIIYVSILDVLDSSDSHFLGRYKRFAEDIYHNFYKKSIDSIPMHKSSFKEELKKQFFSWEWFRVYDFIEYLLSNDNYINNFEIFIESIKRILQEEFSAYSIVNNQVAPITNQYEINTIENAMSSTSNFTSLVGANIHLTKALEMISDKKNPDYRNSIKESISAVECVAKIISGNTKDSLGSALDKIKGKIKLHPSLERGFKQIYGYTSDSSGIRHALMDNDICHQEDALYILISSSSFINYLVAKAKRAEIQL